MTISLAFVVDVMAGVRAGLDAAGRVAAQALRLPVLGLPCLQQVVAAEVVDDDGQEFSTSIRRTASVPRSS